MNRLTDIYPAPADPAPVAQTNFQLADTRLWGQTDVAYATSMDISFSDESTRNIAALTGDLTLTGSNYAAGRKIEIWLDGGTGGNLTLPGGWLDDGTIPASLAAGEIGRLLLICTGTTEASVRASYTAFS